MDPITGQPFSGNQIPAEPRRSERGRAAADSSRPRTFPADQQNYHVSTTAQTSSEAFSLRVDAESLADRRAAAAAARRRGRVGGGFWRLVAGGRFGGPGGGWPRPRHQRRPQRRSCSTAATKRTR